MCRPNAIVIRNTKTVFTLDNMGDIAVKLYYSCITMHIVVSGRHVHQIQL